MIAKVFALVQGARSGPPSPYSPFIGAACILIGVRLVQTYAEFQRKVIADQAQELGNLVGHIHAARGHAAASYPAREDVDPLDRAEAEDDDA